MQQESINCSQQNLVEIPNIVNPDVVTNLNMSFNQISELPVMNQFLNLRFLTISHNKFINLTPLAALTHLVELDCSYNQIKSIDFIFSMTELQVFQCSNNKIKKIQPCFPRNIQSIDLSNNPIKSLSFIENSGLTKLEYLNISNASIKHVSDIKFLRFLPKLQELNIPIPTNGEKVNFTEIVRTACPSLKYLNEEDITFFNNETKAKKIAQLFEKGTEDDFVEFLHQPDLTFTWKNPVFIPFDDSPPPLDRESIRERLTVLEATMIAPNFATDLKFKLNSLEKQLKLIIAPPTPKNEMGETISLITPFKEGDEAVLDSLLYEVQQIKKQLGQVTQILYGQDTAIKKLWDVIYGN